MGWLWHKYTVECTDNKWRDYGDGYWFDGFHFQNSMYAELGLMLRYKKMFVNGGLQVSFLENELGMYSHVGIGMFF